MFGQNGRLTGIASRPTYDYLQGLRFVESVASASAAVVTSVAVTAATGKQNDRNDDEPNPVVVKQIAKTVVHDSSSKVL